MQKKFCTFYANHFFFGIAVDQVQEVMRHQLTEHVPLAPNVVEGLINLRGQIVTAIDLRARLGFPKRRPRETRMHVVVRTDEAPVSLLVDEIGDVLEVGDEVFEPPPESLQGLARELILGAYKLNTGLLLVLNQEKRLI